MSRSRKRPDQRSRGRRGGRKGNRPAERGAGFWGDPTALPPPRRDLRMTGEAAATVRSLGPPPLPGHEVIAGHYFTAVYDRAVTLAGALGAVGGFIEPEELQQREEG